MTKEQFDALVSNTKMQPGSQTYGALREVLVSGSTAAHAAQAWGISRVTVSKAIKSLGIVTVTCYRLPDGTIFEPKQRRKS